MIITHHGQEWACTDGEFTVSDGSIVTTNVATSVTETDCWLSTEEYVPFRPGMRLHVTATVTSEEATTVRVMVMAYDSTRTFIGQAPVRDYTVSAGGTVTADLDCSSGYDALAGVAYVRPIVCLPAHAGNLTVSALARTIEGYSDSPVPEYRAVAYNVLGSRIGVLPDAVEMTITRPRNDDASLTLSYAVEGLRADVLRTEVEVAVEETRDGGATWWELPAGRFVAQETSWDDVAGATETLDFNGVSISHMLEEAVLWEVPTESQDTDGKWNFLSRTAGAILRTVWDAAQTRGWGAGLTLDVTASHDSAGAAWATVTTLAFAKTITLGKVLQSLTDIGMVDWEWQGRTLRVWNADTVRSRDLSDTVSWPYAVGTTAAPESKSWADLCTDVLVKGEGGNSWAIHNSAAPAGMRRIEKVVEAGGVELEATAIKVAEAVLQSGANVAEEITREWRASDMRWLPGLDYRPGDWIGLQRRSGIEKLQVVQVSITQNAEGVSGHTTFGTLLDDILSRVAKKTKGVVGAASIAGNTTRPAEQAAKRTPATPSGLVCTASPYAYNGAERAVLTAAWGAVSTDTRGNALDGIEYELMVRQGTSAHVYPAGTATTIDVEGLRVGTTYSVQVRASASGEGTVSAWSGIVFVTPGGDVTAPPVPTAPTVDGTLAVLQATWDGNFQSGALMPDDFDHIEVSATTTASGRVVVGRTHSPSERTVRIPGLSYGTYYVRLRAFDAVGNASDWGPYTTVELESVVDADAIRDEIEKVIPEIDPMSEQYERASIMMANGTLKWGPYPPDEGVPGETYWVAPDGKLWRMKTRAGA